MDSNRHDQLPKDLNNVHGLFNTAKPFEPTNGSHWLAHILRGQIIVRLRHVTWWQFRIARCGHHRSRLHGRMFFLHIRCECKEHKDNIRIRIKKFIRWRWVSCQLAYPFWDRTSFLTNICDRVAALWAVLILCQVFCHWMATKCIVGVWKWNSDGCAGLYFAISYLLAALCYAVGGRHFDVINTHLNEFSEI